MLCIEAFATFSYERGKAEGLTDKSFNMVNGKEVSLERQSGYQILEEMFYKQQDISGNLGF